MRFACLRVAHLACLVEDLHDPLLAQRPLIVLRPWDERVLDVLRADGIEPGQTRRRVEQLCPEAAILPAREALYQAFHQALQRALLNFSQAVETTDLGAFFIEIGALAHTFASEQALAQEIMTQAQAAANLPATLGIAGNKFCAWQAASAPIQPCVVPAGTERAFLANLPLTDLPDPPPEMIRRLHLFGLTTLGDLAVLPRSAVAAQFGAETALFHDLARGLDPRPLQPQAPPPLIRLTRRLPEPLTNRRPLLALTERAAQRLAERLQAGGHQATALTLALNTTISPQELIAGAPLKPPTADADTLARIGGRLLGKLAPESGVTSLSLTAYPLRVWRLDAQQLSLSSQISAPRLSRLHEALQEIWRRFGAAIIRLASAIGPPLPLPIQVTMRPDGQPTLLRWGGWARPVTEIYESWREERRWWEQPTERTYFQVVVGGDVPFTIFQDERRRWFLDRRCDP